MKRSYFVLLLTAVGLIANAEVYTFDFHQPATLNPPVAEPAQKESVNLNGRSFTSGPVEVSFEASESGNTHVRLYHSYDAGIDLRIYDNDVMNVNVPDNYYLKSIQFTMSLSGNATGSNDINFIPDNGDFVWEDERWTPDVDSFPCCVALASAQQSRIYTMSVDVEDLSSIAEISCNDNAARYFTLSGQPLSVISSPGVYLKVSASGINKIVVR